MFSVEMPVFGSVQLNHSLAGWNVFPAFSDDWNACRLHILGQRYLFEDQIFFAHIPLQQPRVAYLIGIFLAPGSRKEKM